MVCLGLTRLLVFNGLKEEKKIFEVQSKVRTNQSISKRAGMKTGLLLPQCDLKYTKASELLF